MSTELSSSSVEQQSVVMATVSNETESLAPCVPFSYKRKATARRLSNFSINKLKFSNLDLYGRKSETKQLFDALHRLTNESSNTARKNKEVVLITGPSGCGKSKLAEQLRTAHKKNGHIRNLYATGKFGLQQRNEPFSAFGSACRNLCDCVISHLQHVDDDNNEKAPVKASFKTILDNLRTELGVEARALFPLIPQLRTLLGTTSSESNVTNSNETDESLISDDADFTDNKNQFYLALRRFMRAIGSVIPICLVLDDIQWADEASLDAINALLTDRNSPCSIMLVATYRSNIDLKIPKKVAKILTKMQELRDEEQIASTTITIDNLQVADVNDLVADLVSSDRNEKNTQDLAQLVHRKTDGNAFFVQVFLNALVSKELLQYNFGLSRWTWNMADIEIQTRVSENVVDVLTQKMKHMPNAIRHGLLLAACMGSTFDERLLMMMMESSPRSMMVLDAASSASTEKTLCSSIPDLESTLPSTSAEDWLKFCQIEGLIEPCGESLYRWVHDKVQESALRLASEQTLSSIKLQVGKVLALECWSSTILEDNLFVAIDHLNEKSGEFSVEDTRALKIVELNLRAGKKSIEASAFHAAIEYLRYGISFLSPDCWQSQYDLTLQLYTLAAKAEYSCGDYTNMKSHCQTTILHSRSLRDSMPVYSILIDATGNSDGAQKAVDLSIEILAKWGCIFPKYCRKLHIALLLLRLKMSAKKLHSAKLSVLAPITDESRIEIMAILVKLSGWATLADSDLRLFAASKSFHWTLKYGLDKDAPVAIATVGIIVGAALGDTTASRECCLQALKLSTTSDLFKSSRPRTEMYSYGLILPRSQSLGSCMHPMLNAYKASIEEGDLVVGTWCIYLYLQLAFHSGRKLEEVDAGFRENVWKMKEAKQMRPCNFSQAVWQSVLNLMGQSSNPLLLTGEAMDEKSFIQNFDTQRDQEMIAILNFQHLQLACLLGNHKVASKIALASGNDYPSYLMDAPRHRFYSALACASMARQTGKRKYMRETKRLSRMIKRWVKKKNPNVIHCDLLVDAELAALNGNTGLARKMFEESIRVAARCGFINDQAIANERFAEFLLQDMRDRVEASYHTATAIQLYEEWGATVKVEQLQAIHAEILLTSNIVNHVKSERGCASSTVGSSTKSKHDSLRVDSLERKSRPVQQLYQWTRNSASS